MRAQKLKLAWLTVNLASETHPGPDTANAAKKVQMDTAPAGSGLGA